MDIFFRVIFLLGGLFFVDIGILLLILCLQKINLFWKHKKQRIGNIKTGKKVFISGYIDQSNKLIKSPITHKSCAAWEAYAYTLSHTNSQRGSKKVILLYLSSDHSLILTDGVDKIKIFPEKTASFNMFFGSMVESGLQISKPPNFMDNQNVFSNFRDSRTLMFLAANNFEKLNYLGLRRTLTVVEKTLVPGDKLFVWGEVMSYENQTVINAKLISDTMTWQIGSIILFLVMGLLFFIVGLGICKQVFIYS
jgi:hypothetical protein